VLEELLTHAGEEKHLVVHREAEEDREHDHGDRRRHRRLGVDPEQPAGETFVVAWARYRR
jgi:hypothetical protein